VVTVAEILAGVRLNLPMARHDAVKSAEAMSAASAQAELF
jgi:hypothetical protein